MKTIMLFMVISCFLLLGTVLAQASDVSVNANINIDNKPDRVVLAEPPEFIYPSSLGFYVAVGIPYDMFYLNSRYYLYRGNVWYIASGYNGPWIIIEYSRLPKIFRRYKYQRIITLRDEEYRSYHRDRDRYRGKYFRPEKQKLRGERNDHERGNNYGRENGDGERQDKQ
jgi:hypothetical protein